MNMQDIFSEDIGNGTPLVLVHGFLGSSDMWSPQIKFFKDNFRVIAPALPGFGKSNAIDSCDSIKCMAKAILNLLDKN
jgi:pimeloyl-ACP methyl ester carboxylesterase